VEAVEDGGDEDPKPGLIDRVRNGLRSRSAVAGDLAAAESRVESLEQELGQWRGRAEKAEARVQVLEGEQAEIEKALKESQEQNTSTEEAAAKLLEQRGFAAEDLPASQSRGAQATVEEIEQELEKCTDPAERYVLAGKLEEAEKAAAQAG